MRAARGRRTAAGSNPMTRSPVAHGTGRCHSLVRRRARNAAVIRLPARSELRWDIAAMAPIRTINMYIFIISPGLGRPLTARRIDRLQ